MNSLWRRGWGWLAPALRPEDGDEAGLLAELAAGRAQLWLGERSAMATQLLSEDGGLILHVWLAGGALDDILALRPGAEAWARAMGCEAVTIAGRPGWARVLKRFGYVARGGELRRSL